MQKFPQLPKLFRFAIDFYLARAKAHYKLKTVQQHSCCFHKLLLNGQRSSSSSSGSIARVASIIRYVNRNPKAASRKPFQAAYLWLSKAGNKKSKTVKCERETGRGKTGKTLQLHVQRTISVNQGWQLGGKASLTVQQWHGAAPKGCLRRDMHVKLRKAKL